MKARHVYGRGGSPDRYYLDGKEVTREEYQQSVPDVPLDFSNGAPSLCPFKPIISDALAVHPTQIKEAMERDKKHGLSVEYLPDGRPKLDGRDKRRRMLKSLNFHDNHGGYGDG